MFHPKVRRSKRLEEKLKKKNNVDSLVTPIKDAANNSSSNGANDASGVMDTCHDRLYRNALSSEKKKELHALSSVQREMKTHTFKPKIFTANSPVNRRVIAGLNDNKMSVVERLHAREKMIAAKKKEMAKKLTEEQCSFSPKFETGANGSRSNSSGHDLRQRHPRTMSTANAIDRLYNPSHLKDLKEERDKKHIQQVS